MKAKDKPTLDVLRLLKASVQNEQIAKGADLSVDEEIAVLAREMKQRRDSVVEYKAAGRADLVEGVEAGMAVVEKYLPAQLSDDEVRQIVADVIAETGATSAKEFGKVMGALMPKVKGKADGNLVNSIVKDLLK